MTTTDTTARCPNPTTKLGRLFAGLVRRAMVPAAPGTPEGIPLVALAEEIGESSAYASALLCTLLRRELAARVSTGRYLPTATGIAAAVAIYGRDMALYGPDMTGLTPPGGA